MRRMPSRDQQSLKKRQSRHICSKSNQDVTSLQNNELRKANRTDEEDALKGGVKLLQDSRAYQTWVAEDHNETLGDCLSTCTPDEEDVKCKACLTKVSIPGYCAGHPGTKGC